MLVSFCDDDQVQWLAFYEFIFSILYCLNSSREELGSLVHCHRFFIRMQWITFGPKRMWHPNIRYDKWKSAFLLIVSFEFSVTVSLGTLTHRKCQPYEMCWIFVFSLTNFCVFLSLATKLVSFNSRRPNFVSFGIRKFSTHKDFE